MILHPAILALSVGSLLCCLMLFYAGWYGVRILTDWDLASGSELQLTLERRTYLLSTLVAYALAFQTVSLFLFIFTADRLHPLFTGAMCAAGTLNAAPYGYQLLILKLVNFLLAGVWLLVNHADTRCYDYPLIRFKYALLLLLVPTILIEFVLQCGFFLGLHADVITSCCGSLFSLGRAGLAGELAGLPVKPTETVFVGGMALTLGCGTVFLRTGRGSYLFSLASFATFAVSIAALISFICLYIYELPGHHCPFCLLQGEYGYIGYLLYATLLGGAVTGLAVGVLTPFRRRGSMVRVIPSLQRRLTAISLLLYLVFCCLSAYNIIFSSFRLDG
ncbi:hypothetical protein [Geomonas sp.]|uniref:hypothetical protein n=1 Tax=Geomonas sp. TaxID=2651584 RepID=UPI002B45AF85|nr:hypothetical protein [Geomonas sp.]HJV36179.1 hypothetical protein [Geomonas sp.]